MPTALQKLRRAPTSPRMSGLLDMSGRRWALRVVWELRGGALNFRALREACGGISPGVLQRRLHEWRRTGVIEKIPGPARVAQMGQIDLASIERQQKIWMEAGLVKEKRPLAEMVDTTIIDEVRKEMGIK